MIVDLLQVNRLAIHHPHRRGNRLVVRPGIVVKGHVVVPKQDVVDRKWRAIGPLDALADFENRGSTRVSKFKTFCEVVYNAVRQGPGKSHQVFAQGFIRARCLDDVARECAAQDAPILSDGVYRDDHEGIFRQAFRDRREFAAFDFFSEAGSFAKGAVDQNCGIDLLGRARFADHRIGLHGLTRFALPRIGRETPEKEKENPKIDAFHRPVI